MPNLNKIDFKALMYRVQNGLTTLSELPMARRSAVEHELHMIAEREKAEKEKNNEKPKRRRRPRRRKEKETQ